MKVVNKELFFSIISSNSNLSMNKSNDSYFMYNINNQSIKIEGASYNSQVFLFLCVTYIFFVTKHFNDF